MLIRWTVTALVAVLAIGCIAVVATVVTGTSSVQLTTSILGFCGLIIAALIQLLTSQVHEVHTQLNARMDQLLQAKHDAGFEAGKAEASLPAATTTAPPGG